MNIKSYALLLIIAVTAFAFMGCTPQKVVFELIAPVEVLAQVEPFHLLSDGEVTHIQWIYEELEGLPPNSQNPQFIRTTTNLWAESVTPWRYRYSATIEPGGVVDDGGWGGNVFWKYDLESAPNSIIVNSPAPEEIPNGPLEVSRFFLFSFDLLEQAQKTPDRLRDLGTEEIESWGKVHLIAYDWDGVTAPTVRFRGYPHTIIFKITEADHQLIEWSDLIKASEGEVVHRHYQLTVWDVLNSTEIPENLFVYAPSKGVEIVDELPEPTPTATIDVEGQPVRKIADWEVPDYGFVPWLPTDLPEGMTLQSIELLGVRGGYLLNYELNGNPVMSIHQGIEVGYGWGNQPEVIELSWATVEIAAIEPMGPPGWIAFIKIHQVGSSPVPNINILVEIPDKELVMKIIVSFQPASE